MLKLCCWKLCGSRKNSLGNDARAALSLSVIQPTRAGTPGKGFTSCKAQFEGSCLISSIIIHALFKSPDNC